MKQKYKLSQVKIVFLTIILILLIPGNNSIGAVKRSDIYKMQETGQLEILHPNLFIDGISSGITCVFFYNEMETSREMEKLLMKIKNEYDDYVRFRKIDLKQIAGLYIKYAIPQIPCVIIYKDGDEKGGIIGESFMSSLREMINRYK